MYETLQLCICRCFFRRNQYTVAYSEKKNNVRPCSVIWPTVLLSLDLGALQLLQVNATCNHFFFSAVPVVTNYHAQGLK